MEDNYYCENCDNIILPGELEWANDTPICPFCGAVIKE